MAEKDKKGLDLDSLEVTELDDQDLDDVAGGGADNQCPITNYNCPSCTPTT